MRRHVHLRTRALVFGLAALAIVAVVGTAAAGPAGAVKTFTGCLVVGDGVIVKVKEGDQPKSVCTSGQTLARLSGGDITKISVTGGLTLTNGGESGDVEINLDSKYSLPQGCSDGQIAKWNGSGWSCAADDNTTYSAGTGLALTGTQFSIAPDYRVKNTPDCSSGQFATGFDGSGNIQCAAPLSAGAVQVFAALESPESGIGIPSDSASHDVVSLIVPAGTYSITAIGNASQGDQREWGLDCFLFAGATEVSEAIASVGTDQPGGGINFAYSLAMASLRSFGSSTTLKVACATGFDGVGAEHFVIQAIRYG